jgi:hypothetical protein
MWLMKLEVKATWWNVKELKYIVLAIIHVGIISFLFQSHKLGTRAVLLLSVT